MDKTILFVSDKTKYFFPMINQENIKVEEVFKKGMKEKYSFIIRVCRKLKIPIGIFFEHWTMRIEEFTKIIIFDGCYDKLLVYYLNSKNPSAEKYVFCWNSKKRLGHVLGTPYKAYSFDQQDATDCSMEFIPTFYSNEVKIPEKELQYDIVYLAKLKERKDEIINIYKNLKSHGIIPYFYLVGTEEVISEINIEVQTAPLNYMEYLELISKSKCILDINNKGQIGLSQRVMEALFLRKKLMTTNVKVKEYDFYNKNNIFIIEHDNYEGAEEFMMIPYVPVYEEIVEKYDVCEWIKKFQI